MTSMASEALSAILVSCRQTRFHIESPNYRELDIAGLNITVTSAEQGDAKASKKGKGKAAPEGTEILNNANLRLKAGQRYALVGRNGSGKSTLLRAVTEKLIPGIPEATRIAILQQTNAKDVDTDVLAAEAVPEGEESSKGRSVLEEVIEKATARFEAEQEIRTLSSGVASTETYGTLRALRKVRHERLQKELFRKDKDARLRSGARGWDARKALIAFEKTVAESNAKIEEPDEDITAEALKAETQEAIDMLAELQLQVEPSRISEIESRAKKILAGLGFSEEYMAKPVSSLSGGWLMRTALATCLLQETDILILDEPTNFLDMLGIIWLQRYLLAMGEDDDAPTLILVSHDRDFTSLCTDLLILKDKTLTYYHGDLPTYESSRAEKKLYLTKMKDAQDRQKAHIQQSIVNNIKAGKANDDQNKLRQAKSRQKKLDDRWGLQVNHRGGRFRLHKDYAHKDYGIYGLTARTEIDVPQDDRPVSFFLPEPLELRFPGPLISLENVSYRYPAPNTKTKTKVKITTPLVLDSINLSVHMGDRVGILGLNGAGKSTLVKLLVDEARPTSGTVTTHPRLKLGYYSQHAVEALQALGRAEPALTALALLSRDVAAAPSGGGDLDEGDLRGLLGALGLPGRLASDLPLRRLSGGQLVRCGLARLLWRRPHCLVLDEVTTHLDYETVAAAREALRAWAGAVVLVSHDRWLVRGVVEGERDDDGDEDDDGGSEDEDEALRRRVVYRLRAGKMTLLERGVTEFEEGVEKRVKKLLA